MNPRPPPDHWDHDPESVRQRQDGIVDQVRREQNRRTTFHQPSRLHGRLRPGQRRRRWLRGAVLVGLVLAAVSTYLAVAEPTRAPQALAAMHR